VGRRFSAQLRLPIFSFPRTLNPLSFDLEASRRPGENPREIGRLFEPQADQNELRFGRLRNSLSRYRPSSTTRETIWPRLGFPRLRPS